MTDKELMQQALEALRFALHVGFDESSESQIKKGDKAVRQHENVIAALRERLAQPKHDYRTRYDRGCYKCGSQYCPADCPEPTHLVSRQLEQEPNMPKQYMMIGRFMLQPHPQNGYWLTDTGTSEAMQIFQPEMEKIIKELWGKF